MFVHNVRTSLLSSSGGGSAALLCLLGPRGRRAEVREGTDALVGAGAVVTRQLAGLPAASQSLEALAAAAHIRQIARLVERHLCTVGGAAAGNALGARRARNVFGVAIVVRAMAAGAGDDAGVVAAGRLRAAGDWRVNNTLSAPAVQRVDANVCARWARPLVTQLAALVDTARGLLVACPHTNVPLVAAALLLALVLVAAQHCVAALLALVRVLAHHSFDNLPR